MTTATRTDSPTAADRTRQVGVTLAEVLCVLGTLVGTGVLGTPVSETSGGALSDQATLLAPAGPAFSIWSVIYAGLLAYTVWQWLPGRATDPRLRATGWLAAASMVLNAAWLLVTQAGWIWGSVAVIVALVLVLGLLAQRLVDLAPTAPDGGARVAELVAVDGTVGLYLGWVTVAACANVAAALADSGVDPGSPVADVAAVVVLAVVAGLAAFYGWRLGRRTTLVLAVGAAMVWGLAWISYGRSAEAPESLATSIAAGVVALLVAVAVLAGAAQSTGRSRNAN